MARRRVGDFDALMEQWARWLDSGSAVQLGGGASLLARWMDSKGHMVFGGTATQGGPLCALEERIELAAIELGKVCALREDVLRLEYAAGWWRVAGRRGLKGYDPRGLGQLQNALRLGVSVRTYRLRLAEARAFMAQRLETKA